jgi:hypothetical protein
MLTGRTVTVGTTAVDLLDGIDTDRELAVRLRVRSTSNGELYLGDSSVSSTNGFKVPTSTGEELVLELHGDTLWAVSASGGGNTVVDVLVISDK